MARGVFQTLKLFLGSGKLHSPSRGLLQICVHALSCLEGCSACDVSQRSQGTTAEEPGTAADTR